MTDTEKVLLTVEEAADRLSIGRTKAYELVAKGDLESVTIGRCRRVPVRALDPFVAELLADRVDAHPFGARELKLPRDSRGRAEATPSS